MIFVSLILCKQLVLVLLQLTRFSRLSLVAWPEVVINWPTTAPNSRTHTSVHIKLFKQFTLYWWKIYDHAVILRPIFRGRCRQGLVYFLYNVIRQINERILHYETKLISNYNHRLHTFVNTLLYMYTFQGMMFYKLIIIQ